MLRCTLTLADEVHEILLRNGNLSAQGMEMHPKKIMIKNEIDPRNAWVHYELDSVQQALNAKLLDSTTSSSASVVRFQGE